MSSEINREEELLSEAVHESALKSKGPAIQSSASYSWEKCSWKCESECY